MRCAETGDVWQTIINSNNIQVSYLIYSAGGSLLAYVSGTHFIEDDIDIQDSTTNQIVANLYRNKLSFSAWTWQITAYNTSHPAGTLVVWVCELVV